MSGIKISKQYETQETIALGWVIIDGTTGKCLSSGLTEQGKKNMDNNKDDYMKELETALYKVMDSKDLAYAKEIAAEALGEDLDEYLEEEGVDELDFEKDDFIVDEEFEDK